MSLLKIDVEFHEYFVLKSCLGNNWFEKHDIEISVYVINILNNGIKIYDVNIILSIVIVSFLLYV